MYISSLKYICRLRTSASPHYDGDGVQFCCILVAYLLLQVFVVDEERTQQVHAFNQLQYSEEELRLQEQLGRDRLSRSQVVSVVVVVRTCVRTGLPYEYVVTIG